MEKGEESTEEMGKRKENIHKEYYLREVKGRGI